jgi:hypothetical protein
MPPVKSLSPPIGGWRGLNPTVVIQIAQLMQAGRLLSTSRASPSCSYA